MKYCVHLSTGKNLKDDAAELAELMKSDMEDTLKIQRSPWLDWDVLEFEDVYLPVELNKENRNQNVELVREYKELFTENFDLNMSDTRRKKRQRHKILIKGAPGVGKTTLVAKIAYDWAVSALKTFSLVFLVSLKCVNPGDPINSFIIDKNLVPSVYESEYDFQNIDGIVRNFGSKCLLILEGFDEGSINEDVMRIIRNLKYASCNIIVTTRPHVAGDIQRYFTTVVNLTGFTKEDAEKYMRNLMTDKGKIESVLRFTEENQSVGIYEMWRYPILVLFVCILVNDGEQNLDLNDRNVTLADIYSRLHECLYKRFTVKRDLPFERDQMTKTLMRLGRLAWKGLRNGILLFKKKKIEENLGKEAFHFGIIIGYQDRRVIDDLSADCTVCFLQQSIQEYLAALYIVNELECSDRQIEDIWPGTWDYDSVSKIPLLLVFAIDQCKGRVNAKKKLIYSMASILNQRQIIIQGYNIGKSTLVFLAEVTQQCYMTNALTFVNSGFNDDTLTWVDFLRKMSNTITKVTFNRCIFRKCSAVISDKMEKACQIFNSQLDFKFDKSDIPVRALQFLIGKCQCIHTLDINHRNLPLDEKQFYKSLLDLLSVPLPSLKKLEIIALRENYWSSSLYNEQPDDLDYQIDFSSFTGNLPYVSQVKINWGTLCGQLFCNVIMTACHGNKYLEVFVAQYDYDTGSTREMMRGVLSLSCDRMKVLVTADCDSVCDRDISSHQRQRMLSDPNDSNGEISNPMLPQIDSLHQCHLVLFTGSEIEALMRALYGGPLRILTVNNFQLPYLMPVLQSKGLPKLKSLLLYYKGIISIEPECNQMFTEDEAAVCSLPKLKSLEFKQLHGLMTVHQNLLKQLFVAVRGSLCLTVLDISGQNAAACLKNLLFPEGLPALTEFKAEDCGLLPVDIYRLGKAAQTNRLPSLKNLILSRNPNISNFLCYLFKGTWLHLESLVVEEIELTYWDLVFLVCIVSASDHWIMPKLNALFCDAIFISKLKYLVQSGVSLSASNKVQVIFTAFDDLMNDPFMKFSKYDLEIGREEVLDQLQMLQDRDEQYHCYGPVRQWIIDFLRRKQIEIENEIIRL